MSMDGVVATESTRLCDSSVTLRSDNDDNDSSSSLSLSFDDEDALFHILSYLDVTSAVRLLNCTNRTWCKRAKDLQAKILPRVFWRQWYDRTGYSPAKLGANANVLSALAESRRLHKNLMGRSSATTATTRTTTKKKAGAKHSNCFSLPNRWFSFLPIAPDDDVDNHHRHHDDDDDEIVGHANDFFMMDDPPPVSFDCDSFLLTGQGTEFVLLNPFTMTVKVHKSVLDHVIHSDEGMMEKAWRAASHRIVQQQERRVNEESSSSSSDSEQCRIGGNDGASDDNVEDAAEEERLLAADAIQETLHRNHYVRQHPYRVDPQQTLVGLQDTVDVRLEDYFPAPDDNNPNHRRQRRHNDDDDEYELSYAGIDAKPVWNDEGELQGTLLALGRIVTRFDAQGNVAQDEETCWEVLTWYKGSNQDTYTRAGSSRFRGSYHTLDVCPYQQVVYVNPSREGREAADDNIFMMWAGQGVIRAFPLTDQAHGTANAVAEWQCQNPVTSMVVSPFYPGNDVVVGTNARSLEVYRRTPCSADLTQEISIPTVVSAVYQRYKRQTRPHPAPVTEIFCAKDLPLNKAGFWTLQHSSLHGSTLLLWKLQQSSDGTGEVRWDIATILKLPLSSQRTPKILYDGRRLLVYGQDHIGMILLVYHVRYSNEDDFSQIPVGTETSGGILNVNLSVASTRFVNRIRHVGLGGLENIFYESVYMTANERFVILNTKNGNLLSGSSTPYREGLLVIDLRDDQTF